MPFDAENQPANRKPRGRGKRTILLEALKGAGVTEEGLSKLIVEKALEEARKGNISQASILLDKLYPQTRPSLDTFEFELDESATPTEKANSIIKAVSMGDIPADVGLQILSMIQASLSILELSELADDIEKIKESLKEIK